MFPFFGLTTEYKLGLHEEIFSLCCYGKGGFTWKYVDDVVMNIGGKDSKISIEQVKPDYIVIGSDWAKKDYYTQMGFDQDWLDQRGIGLIYVPYTKEISSTKIKGRM